MTDVLETLERIRSEVEEVNGLIARLESDLEEARDAKNKAEVIRRHVLRNPEKFSPHERQNVFERAQQEAERAVRLETTLDASRERIELLRSLEPLLAAPPTVSTAAPETSTTLLGLVDVHAAVDAERARIARDLNDGPAQVLSNLVLEAEILERLLRRDPGLVEAELEEFKATVRGAVADMRRVMFDLRPLSLDDRGLVAAIRALVGEYEERTGIACRFELEGDHPLPGPVEEALYRIVQEALVNVSRHSGAKNVGVELALGDDGIRLGVKDDGHGFDPEAIEPGNGRSQLGLAGMRERAASIRGRVEIRSQRGQGTEVIVEAPI